MPPAAWVWFPRRILYRTARKINYHRRNGDDAPSGSTRGVSDPASPAWRCRADWRRSPPAGSRRPGTWRSTSSPVRLPRARLPGPHRERHTRILGVAGRYYVNEEEVPRAGKIVTRGFQRARWFDGRTLVWVGRRATAGRGEGSSGLAFDQRRHAASDRVTARSVPTAGRVRRTPEGYQAQSRSDMARGPAPTIRGAQRACGSTAGPGFPDCVCTENVGAPKNVFSPATGLERLVAAV